MINDLKVYDINIDSYRSATQSDIDRMEKFINAVCTLGLMEIPEEHGEKSFDFQLAVFTNPWRADGVFVAEAKEIEPYSGITSMDGRPVYPATPNTPFLLRAQVEKSFAEEIVRRWNKGGENQNVE